MDLNKAIQGFLITKDTELSQKTVALYRRYLLNLSDYLGNPDVFNVTENQLSEFMNYLKNEYIPARNNNTELPLSNASIDNYWKAIRSFFTWATETLSIDKRPDVNLKRPKVVKPEIVPFTKDQIDKILYSCTWTKEAETTERKSFRMKRPTADRDKAIVLIFLDTGIRLGEFCRIKYKDITLENGEIRIQPYSTGIKSKPRTVFLGKAAKKALWYYLTKQDTEYHNSDLLFNVSDRTVQSLFVRLSERTGIHVHAHKFRHTFAIQYLRNGGDVFTLKRQLGHSSLKMVMYYLALAESDDFEGHRIASPVDRWKL